MQERDTSSSSSTVKTVTNEKSLLNPQMRQIDADGESEKRTAQELERPCLVKGSKFAEGPCVNPGRFEA
jgi:hypothetical protein